MGIQEESNNVSLTSKFESNVVLEEANTLIYAYDSRELPNHGKSSTPFGVFHNSKKDSRMCIYCSRSGHTINVCYHKNGFPLKYGKK